MCVCVCVCVCVRERERERESSQMYTNTHEKERENSFSHTYTPRFNFYAQTHMRKTEHPCNIKLIKSDCGMLCFRRSGLRRPHWARKGRRQLREMNQMLVQRRARKERKERNELHCPLEFNLFIVSLLTLGAHAQRGLR